MEKKYISDEIDKLSLVGYCYSDLMRNTSRHGMSIDTSIKSTIDSVKYDNSNIFHEPYLEMKNKAEKNNYKDIQGSEFDSFFRNIIKGKCAIKVMRSALESDELFSMAKGMSNYINRHDLEKMTKIPLLNNISIQPSDSIKEALCFSLIRNDVRLNIQPKECQNDISFILAKNKTQHHLRAMVGKSIINESELLHIIELDEIANHNNIGSKELLMNNVASDEIKDRLDILANHENNETLLMYAYTVVTSMTEKTLRTLSGKGYKNKFTEGVIDSQTKLRKNVVDRIDDLNLSFDYKMLFKNSMKFVDENKEPTI